MSQTIQAPGVSARTFAVATFLAIALVAQAMPSRGAAAPLQLAQSSDSSSSSSGDSGSSISTDSGSSISTDSGSGVYDSGARSNRSVFLSLFAANFIPGIAAGLSNWFRVKMFGSDGSGNVGSSVVASLGERNLPTTDSTSTTRDIPSSAAPSSEAPPAGAVPELHAGVAFQVLLLGRDGSRVSVDPASREFRSGERFEVVYRPNFPGVVVVTNVAPNGVEQRIDRVVLGAAEQGRLGPYEFVDEKGEDLLKITLHPCVGGDGQATRGIAKVQIRQDVADALPSCRADTADASAAVATRGIAKVSREGGTSFALDPVASSELAAGRLQPRELVIRFTHR